jgi:PAS domain S-box-containing protein
MRVSKNISVRLKFIILAVIILGFGLFTGLSFIHSENSVQKTRQIESNFKDYFSILHEVDENLMHLVLANYMDSASGNLTEELKSFSQSSDKFIEKLDAFTTTPLINGDSAILDMISEVQINVSNINADIHQMARDSSLLLTDISIITSFHGVIDQMYHAKDEIRALIGVNSIQEQKRVKANILIVLFFSMIIMLIGILAYAFTFDRDLYKILGFVKKLEIGGIPEKLDINTRDEFQDISERLNNYMNQQESKILFLKTIGKGEEINALAPNKNDVIGSELKVMADRLNSLKQEEKQRHDEESKRSWKTDGIAQFGEILRSERENVLELSFNIIQKLVSYLKIEMGTLFLTSDVEGEEQILESLASYAYDRRKFIKKTFKFGEGLPGTCALEKEKIYIDEVPANYSDVISGVGQTKPRFVLLVPLKIEDEIFGILELASFRELLVFELDFVDELAESIASTLAGVKTNEKTAALLKQSQKQAEQLLQQEEKMKLNMTELEKAQEGSRKKESEITGILNAMNESSLVAEFDMSGRFLKINDKFLILMESPKEQILGKNHHEFALIDKYSDEYKNFWDTLRGGESVSREEQFKLYSGKLVWLQQTFTPILNDQGKAYKILNIAVDISQSKRQQDNLEKQAAEITRKSLEMEGLNEAVNSSIIKCEIDHEGIILDLNNNYSEITGFNRKELLGRNYRLFLKDIEKDQFEKIWVEVLKDKTYEGAIRRTKPTGEEAWLMSTFSPVKDESGVIYKIYFLALDITEKRLKYSLLEEANKEVDRLREELQKYEG